MGTGSISDSYWLGIGALFIWMLIIICLAREYWCSLSPSNFKSLYGDFYCWTDKIPSGKGMDVVSVPSVCEGIPIEHGSCHTECQNIAVSLENIP